MCIYSPHPQELEVQYRNLVTAYLMGLNFSSFKCRLFMSLSLEVLVL